MGKNKFWNVEDFLFEKHPYYTLSRSPLPLMLAYGLSSYVVYIISYLNTNTLAPFIIILSTIGKYVFWLALILWLSTVWQRSIAKGFMTGLVRQNFYFATVLFIASEVMFFFSFFWSYFHFSLGPSIWLGGVWPPKGIDAIIYKECVPFTMTAILGLSSMYFSSLERLLGSDYMSVTYVGYNVNRLIKIKTAYDATFLWFWGLFWGFVFLILQYWEYTSVTYSVDDSVYGSIFFLLTGFHGIHVTLGLFWLLVVGVTYGFLSYCNIYLFLLASWRNLNRPTFYYYHGEHDFVLYTFYKEYFVPWWPRSRYCWFKLYTKYLSYFHIYRSYHRFCLSWAPNRGAYTGLSCAVWYWTFVDIVWVGLYICVYFWGTL